MKMHKVHKVMMDTAYIWSKLSYCKRNKVGCVIAKDKRILVTSYNGTLSGTKNICEDKINDELVTNPEVVHAEMNAIAFAAKNGININGCSIYITLSPCIECSKLIFQSGIKEVYYKEKYRKTNGIDFLKENGILIKQIKD